MTVVVDLFGAFVCFVCEGIVYVDMHAQPADHTTDSSTEQAESLLRVPLEGSASSRDNWEG